MVRWIDDEYTCGYMNIHEWMDRSCNILHPTVSQSPSLAIIGAGNCNDLNLHQLTSTYTNITLIDIDSAAVHSAIHRQNITSSHIHVYEAEITGIWYILSTWKSSYNKSGIIPTYHDIDHIIHHVQQHHLPSSLTHLPQYDVIVSLCLLSQFLLRTLSIVSSSSSQYHSLAIATRNAHLATLIHMTHQGGHIILITDTISSRTFPHLFDMDPTHAMDLLNPTQTTCHVESSFHTSTSSSSSCDSSSTSQTTHEPIKQCNCGVCK